MIACKIWILNHLIFFMTQRLSFGVMNEFCRSMSSVWPQKVLQPLKEMVQDASRQWGSTQNLSVSKTPWEIYHPVSSNMACWKPWTIEIGDFPIKTPIIRGFSMGFTIDRWFSQLETSIHRIFPSEPCLMTPEIYGISSGTTWHHVTPCGTTQGGSCSGDWDIVIHLNTTGPSTSTADIKGGLGQNWKKHTPPCFFESKIEEMKLKITEISCE